MNKRGQVAIYVMWFLIAAVIIVVAGVLAPMGVRFNTELYTAGEQILEDAGPSIDSIADDDVRAIIQESVSDAQSAGAENITNLSSMFQYGWIIVLILSAIVVFLFTRRMVEFGAGGFI